MYVHSRCSGLHDLEQIRLDVEEDAAQVHYLLHILVSGHDLDPYPVLLRKYFRDSGRKPWR